MTDTGVPITVCIPAYRAGDFLAETVESVLAQSLDAFRLIIAVDPPDDGDADATAGVARGFLSDPRVTVRVNPRRLGWARNMDTLLADVTTEAFALLPHDDLWAPDYLETLYTALASRPAASVAYADLEYIDPARPGRGHSVALPSGESRGLHLLRFFLQGAHAMPWRGVTRRSSLAATGGFPVDDHLGFAVECEYALGLLQAGEVLHIPKRLYHKRVFKGQDRVSASQERKTLVPVEGRAAAWRRHRDEMYRRLDAAIRDQRLPESLAMLCHHAAFAALLGRRQAMVVPGLADGERLVLEGAIDDCRQSRHPLAAEVVAMLQWQLRRATETDPAPSRGRDVGVSRETP